MKKIGLITYHASHNYGSVLQTYAMQELLKNNFGNDVEIIDFSSKGQKELYSLFVKYDTFRHCIRNVIIIGLYPQFRSRQIAFENFINNNLSLTSESYENLQELEGIDNRFGYDIVVTGSDQVWNTSCIDYDDAYFLPFVKHAEKVAYAPSLGGVNIADKPNDQIDKYRDFLKDFKSISAREKNGKKSIEKIINSEVEMVLDPTLCVDINTWEELAAPREVKGDYIFYYGGIYHPKTYDTVRYISQKLGMPVVTIDYKSFILKGGLFKGLHVAKDGSPANYLSLIKNAKYVVTNSLHGTIFASIFKKDFWVLTFKNTNVYDDRIDSLLEQLGFADRKIYLEDIETIKLDAKIDYKNKNPEFDNLKEKSLNYLANSLR